VSNITDFGAFVDLGGIDGLLHITDMSWGRVSHPSELVSIGDKVRVKVLSFDPEKERISLGMKQLTPYPWEDVDKRYSVTQRVKGKVVSITDYGAFVELEKGIEGRSMSPRCRGRATCAIRRRSLPSEIRSRP
jgi:small subunit ribosomal protein S1